MATTPLLRTRRLVELEERLLQARIHNQLGGSVERHPAAIVRRLGAVQAQDFTGAKWALGLRGAPSDQAVEDAFNAGAILRTHVMRPTWHFVAPEDIRWLLALTAPRVHAANAFMYRTLGLDATVLRRSRAALERALAGGRQLTRSELQIVLARARIVTSGHRLAYVVMHAELDQVLCSGPRHGKQFTYMLLSERAPHARRLERDEALAEITHRYFAGHGPATVRDFAWWCGLTMREAGVAVDGIKPLLNAEVVGDRVYYFVPPLSRPAGRSALTYLLPNYDECLIAYKDRGSALRTIKEPSAAVNDTFQHHVMIGGRVVGSWRREVTTRSVLIDVDTDRPLAAPEKRALSTAAQACGRFMERRAELSVTTGRTLSSPRGG